MNDMELNGQNPNPETPEQKVDVQETVAEVVEETKQAAQDAAETVTDIDDIIRPTTSTGYLYKCIAREGDNETGTEEPTDWPTTVGLTQVDGDITWECIAITKAITLNRGLASAINR